MGAGVTAAGAPRQPSAHLRSHSLRQLLFHGCQLRLDSQALAALCRQQPFGSCQALAHCCQLCSRLLTAVAGCRLHSDCALLLTLLLCGMRPPLSV